MAHIIGGVIATVLGILGMIGWWDNFGDFLRGFIPLALLIAGATAIGAGIRFLSKGK